METKDGILAAAGITFIPGIFFILPLQPALTAFYHHLVSQGKSICTAGFLKSVLSELFLIGETWAFTFLSLVVWRLFWAI
jgi:hypothetical protein